ncbi:hypothetical protein ABIB45_004428 [Arthrobacter sp. UYCo732]
MFKQLQKIGKAFMLPIAILPAAGLLLGIGGALSNPNTVQAYPALNNPDPPGNLRRHDRRRVHGLHQPCPSALNRPLHRPGQA